MQALLQSPRMTPTDAFCVIPGLAAALRATAGGVVELWVWDRAAGCVDALTLVDDADPLAPVTVTVLDHAPVPGVILAGTDRGSVHVLGVTVEGEQGKLHALEYW